MCYVLEPLGDELREGVVGRDLASHTQHHTDRLYIHHTSSGIIDIDTDIDIHSQRLMMRGRDDREEVSQSEAIR
jgi:ribose 1,5-bisphosphokinase PhnN